MNKNGSFTELQKQSFPNYKIAIFRVEQKHGDKIDRQYA
jgi:hypothetical protein